MEGKKNFISDRRLASNENIEAISTEFIISTNCEPSMFVTLLKKISAFNGLEHSQTYEDKFFSNIIGHSDLKKLLLKSIVSKEPVSILLTGPWFL
jgi:hypothetical protein